VHDDDFLGSHHDLISINRTKGQTLWAAQIHRQICASFISTGDLAAIPITSKMSDASRRSRTLSGGAEERRLSRMNNTSQGGAIEGTAADDTSMVDQGAAPTFFPTAGDNPNEFENQFTLCYESWPIYELK